MNYSQTSSRCIWKRKPLIKLQVCSCDEQNILVQITFINEHYNTLTWQLILRDEWKFIARSQNFLYPMAFILTIIKINIRFLMGSQLVFLHHWTFMYKMKIPHSVADLRVRVKNPIFWKFQTAFNLIGFFWEMVLQLVGALSYWESWICFCKYSLREAIDSTSFIKRSQCRNRTSSLW